MHRPTSVLNSLSMKRERIELSREEWAWLQSQPHLSRKYRLLVAIGARGYTLYFPVRRRQQVARSFHRYGTLWQEFRRPDVAAPALALASRLDTAAVPLRRAR